jgi:hypothetical protein
MPGWTVNRNSFSWRMRIEFAQELDRALRWRYPLDVQTPLQTLRHAIEHEAAKAQRQHDEAMNPQRRAA